MLGISLSRAVQIDEKLQVVDELRDFLRDSPTACLRRNVQCIVPESFLKFNSFIPSFHETPYHDYRRRVTTRVHQKTRIRIHQFAEIHFYTDNLQILVMQHCFGFQENIKHQKYFSLIFSTTFQEK